jgi:hypothetical protein
MRYSVRRVPCHRWLTGRRCALKAIDCLPILPFERYDPSAEKALALRSHSGRSTTAESTKKPLLRSVCIGGGRRAEPLGIALDGAACYINAVGKMSQPCNRDDRAVIEKASS